jgi:uncharacterized short protein YbdD (DUF466 family)
MSERYNTPEKKYAGYVSQCKSKFPNKTIESYEEWLARQSRKGVDIGSTDLRIPDPDAQSRLKFQRHRAQAKFRGIDFDFEWEDWHAWWLSNGVDKNQHDPRRGGDRLCMARHGDSGGYNLDNVYICTVSQNNTDAAANGRRSPGRPRGSKNKPKG